MATCARLRGSDTCLAQKRKKNFRKLDVSNSFYLDAAELDRKTGRVPVVLSDAPQISVDLENASDFRLGYLCDEKKKKKKQGGGERS